MKSAGRGGFEVPYLTLNNFTSYMHFSKRRSRGSTFSRLPIAPGLFVTALTVAFSVNTGCRPNSVEAEKHQSALNSEQNEATLRIEKLEYSSDIENLFQLTERIYSGGEPATQEAMKRLSELGIRTVVCVDGVQPNVQLAKTYGMNYVHIPIGYDGISREAGESLAKVVRELEGPVFIHCHHGKHRGPAAAAVCVITETGVDPQRAAEILEQAGTGKNYAGLWRDVASYTPPDSTDQTPPLVEVAVVDSFVAAMAAIGRAHDHLVLLEDSNWQQRADHPDLVASQEALIMYEGYRESLRFLEQSNPYDESMKQEMFAGIRLLESFQSSLTAQDFVEATETFKQIRSGCKSCHTAYRD